MSLLPPTRIIRNVTKIKFIVELNILSFYYKHVIEMVTHRLNTIKFYNCNVVSFLIGCFSILFIVICFPVYCSSIFIIASDIFCDVNNLNSNSLQFCSLEIVQKHVLENSSPLVLTNQKYMLMKLKNWCHHMKEQMSILKQSLLKHLLVGFDVRAEANDSTNRCQDYFQSLNLGTEY